MQERMKSIVAPEEMKKFHACHTSLSYSGDPRRCEGVDFMLERYNMASKMWLPKGVPTMADWQRVFRLLDQLDGVSLISIELHNRARCCGI